MTSLLLALALAQTQPAIRRTTPASDDPGMVVRQAGTASVNCTNCGTPILIDGGSVPISQGPGQDGGAWNVFIEGGNLTISATTTTPDGGLPVNVQGGTVSLTGTDVFGAAIIGSRYNQLEVSYATVDPDLIPTITVTKTNGGDAINSGGQAVYSTSANATGGIRAVTNATTTYRPHAESYGAFTAIFTTGVANSYQRLGIYDANNGFFIGYEGTSFGLTIRKAGVDTFTARASFNLDTLTGGAASKYTRNGTPETMDPTKDQLYRIRYGWLGAAPITYEVLSPDGNWVPFHVIRHPNLSATTSVNNPDLPITLDAQKTSGATNLTVSTACWAAGSTSDLAPITATLTADTLASLNRSVITGQTTGGGGGFVNVKVNPSGALTVAASQDTSPWVVSGTVTANAGTGTFTVGQATPSNLRAQTSSEANTGTAAPTQGSLIMGNTTTAAPTYTNGTANALSLTTAGGLRVDGSGTTQPVSGTVAATQSGTWSVTATQGTAANLRTQTAAEGSTGAAVPAVAEYLGIRNGSGNLTGVQGSAAPVNGTGTLAVVTTPVAKFATNPATAAVSCGTVATAITSSPLTNRMSQCVINNGANTIFIGASTVTTANGFPLPVGASFCDDSGTQSYFCIVAAGTENLRVLEN